MHIVQVLKLCHDLPIPFGFDYNFASYAIDAPSVGKDDASPVRPHPPTRGLEDMSNASLKQDGLTPGFCEAVD